MTDSPPKVIPRRALITGDAGFVGKYLTWHLESTGHIVRGIDVRDGTGDVRDYEDVRTTIEDFDPDYIYHLAALSYVPESTTDPRRAVDVTVTGTLNVLEAVRHLASHARVLITGTSEEYGYRHASIDETTPTWPTTPYGATKLAAGQLGLTYAQLYDIPVVVTRAFNHTGPGHPARFAVPSFAKRIAEVERGVRDKVLHGNLSASRNYTDVRDVVSAYVKVIDQPWGVYNVCSARTVTLQWILDELLSNVTGDVPTAVDARFYRPTNVGFPHVSAGKLQIATGWHTEITLEQTLKDTLNYWRSYYETNQ